MPLGCFDAIATVAGYSMIAYIKIRKALGLLQSFITSQYFLCKTVDANACFFRTSRLYACVKVATDHEKRILEADPRVLQAYHAALQASGIRVSATSLRIESQETVDRDWNGNWFYALFK